ncbi:ectonucleoside triphosphate diphosphohydrolase 1 [Elysia marginata]|uniref:Ectonucleoside triphosphate diphosphohydrolase 1 n=1 Tax=Elysia marginata TaxID=1093978 RepID=A0AAV4GZB4_9GAST|nr:ectonucleoside triphosphate diphosphohydrolase 1 [Elysia marginata]
MGDIEVTVQSVLPSDEPQGRFSIKISKEATVEELLKQLCREANVPVKLNFSLRSNGQDILRRTDSLSKRNIVDGSVLHWTSEAAERKYCKCNTFCFLATLSFLIGIAGIATICAIRFQHVDAIMDYAIVFDAGSTHTSMFVYKWDAAKYEGTAVATQFGETCDAKGPGIGSFENNPSAAGASLIECLKKAESMIPTEKYSNTPVYLGATAGMRLIQLRNPVAAEAILGSIRDTFSVSKFDLINPKTSVRIITGSDEGVFSWVSSNYLANVFNVGPIPRFQYSSAGALDLGGASAQITLIPEDGTMIPEGYSHTVKLYGEDYNVYTHSFLCYGVVQMLNTVHAALIKATSPTVSNIQHVCLPKGYKMTESSSNIFASPCVSGSVKNRNITFVGTGNEKECRALLSDTLFSNKSCPYSQCSFNGVYQPTVSGPFFAFSTYYFVAEFMNLTQNSATFEFEEFENATTKLCKKTWSELQEIPITDEHVLKDLMDYCVRAQYISLLLHDNFNFTEEEWRSVNFVAKVSGSEVGWTLGFILNESDYYVPHKPSPKISTVAFALLMVLFILFIAAGVGLTYTAYKVNLSGAFLYVKMSSYDAI